MTEETGNIRVEGKDLENVIGFLYGFLSEEEFEKLTIKSEGSLGDGTPIMDFLTYYKPTVPRAKLYQTKDMIEGADYYVI